MPTLSETRAPSATAEKLGERWTLKLEGDWRITGPQPDCPLRWGKEKPKVVGLDVSGVRSWDSSIVIWLNQAKKLAERDGVVWEEDTLPEAIRQIQEEHR